MSGLDAMLAIGGGHLERMVHAELVADLIALCHPDRHPAERKEQATRATIALFGLRPYAKPRPPDPPRNGYTNAHRVANSASVTDPAAHEKCCWVCDAELGDERHLTKRQGMFGRDHHAHCKACWQLMDWQAEKQRQERLDAKEREARLEGRRARKAAREVAECWECGEPLADVVWRIRRRVNSYFKGTLPHCGECGPGIHENHASRWAYEESLIHRPTPEPCGGDCGREVVNTRWSATRRVAACSQRCAAIALRRRKGKRQNPDRPCEACGEPFTPTRSDARHCGAACRQRAYRERNGNGQGAPAHNGASRNGAAG